MKIKHFAVVNNGQLRFNNYVQWVKQLNALNGCEVALTIGKKTKQRSLNENNYYWGVVVEIAAEFLGYTQEEAHEAFKWQFLRVERPGKPTTVRSTAELFTVEFEAYLTKIRELLATMGCFVPLPNECEINV